MAFDPDKYLAAKKSGFDPDAYLASKKTTAPVGKDISELESGYKGVIASSGIADELGGIVEALGSKVGLHGLGTNPINEVRSETDEEDQKGFMDTYRAARDEIKRQHQDAQNANPKSYLTGNLAGSVAIGGGMGKILGGAGVGAIKSAGLLGAADGLAQSDADLTKGEVGQAAWDTTKGGLLGAGTAKIGEMVGDGIKALTNKEELANSAADHAIKSLNPILSQQELLNNKGVGRELGRELLDNDVVKFGRSVKDMQPDLENLILNKGEGIGALRKEAQDAGHMIDLTDLKSKAEKTVSNATNGLGVDRSIAKAYRNEVQGLGKIPQRSIEDTQGIIGRIDGKLKEVNAFNRPKTTDEAMMELRKDLVNKVDGAVGKLSPEKLAEYLKAKKQFSLFKQGDEILDKSVARQARNRGFSLTDHIVGGMGKGDGVVQDGITKMALAMANKFARERGNASIATMLDKFSRQPEAFGKFAKLIENTIPRGATSLAATHAILMKDPEYKALVEEQ